MAHTIETRDKRVLWWLPLGTRPYADTWHLQKALVEARRRREIPDLFISVEHPHVITAGRATQPGNILRRDAPDGTDEVPVVNIERGGDVTYHGPGQLVGYFIFDLDREGRDLHRFLRKVEQVQIDLAAACGVEAGRVEGKTGAWVRERKIGSVGIAVRQWITYHGFALNAATDLRYFSLINPCGFDAGVMTSISEVTGRDVTVRDLLVPIGKVLGAVFDRSVVRISSRRLPPALRA